MAQEKHIIFCPVCGTHCCHYAYVENGKVVKIEPALDIARERGFPCDPCTTGKGIRTILGVLNSPDRLKFPLKREGERGEGKWKRISWDEALDTIARKLSEIKDRCGPESVAILIGEPKGLEFAFAQRFATAFGTPNVATPGTYCGVQTSHALYSTFGSARIQARTESNPRVMIIWGSNFAHIGGTFVGTTKRQIHEALEKGCKLIVIDPRDIAIWPAKGWTASNKATLWLRPRPASDGVLAMGMIKLIIEEKLYDKDYVANWTVGFEELQEHVKTFTLEEVEKLTWVPKEQIREAARVYAKNKPGIIGWGNALEQTVCAFQTCRAIAILRALTGNVNTPNGGEFEVEPASMTRPGRFMLGGNLKERLREYPRSAERTVGGEFKIALISAYIPTQVLIRNILDAKSPSIKAALLWLTNPLVTYPDSKEVYRAFMKLDFIVVSDIFHTPTTAIADIVLPVAAEFEHEDIGYWPAWVGFVRLYPKLTDPPGEAWSDMKIVNELAKRVGLEEYFWEDEHEALDYMLEPAGVTYKEFRDKVKFIDRKTLYDPNKVLGYKTPSGKVEIYSNQLKELGYTPLPYFEEVTRPLHGPFELTEEYPMMMTNAKDEVFFLSRYKKIALLHEVGPYPKVWLNTKTAIQLGLKEGDWIYIETKKGKAKQRLVVNPEIHPKVVITTFGWHGESNINLLTDSNPPYEFATGSPTLRGIPCRVHKA